MKQIKYNQIYKFILVTTMFFAVVSCSKVNNFLDEPPSKTTSLVITTADQLDALLNNYSIFYSEGNRTAIYGSDDYELTKALYDARPGTFSSMATIQFMLWDIPFLPDDNREVFWSGEYRKIFYANTVLDYVDDVTGTDEQKAALKADAHFVRAYSYWVLANTYTLPYTEATKGEVGLPIKLSTSFQESFARQPLSKVYEQIEADLAEALKTTVPLVQSGKARHWRANKAAVNGFAARYWLSRHDYAKAVDFANKALAEYSVLVDYNTEMRYGNPQTLTLNSGTPQQSSFTLQYPYTHNNQIDFTDMLGWKEFLYFRLLNHESWWYIPSQELLNLYDQTNDLRFRYHIVEGYSYDRGMTKPSYNYPGYIFFFKDRVPSGPTTAEMYLIKAEGLAHTNQVTGAMDALNTLRAKRMTPGAWVNLTATDKDDAIKKVGEERRREMPFSQRWFDLRRYNNNQYANDDVNLSKSFYPYTNSAVQSTQPVQNYTLPKNSRRWATPLPRTELISSNGEIVQNTY
ncbi:MAG TPA: RagB/SusD family nutrient uptake outer membrane protein [Chitinophagaceae bacterium]